MSIRPYQPLGLQFLKGYINSLYDEEKNIKEETWQGVKMAVHCVPAFLLFLVETVTRAIFALISAPIYLGAAFDYALTEDEEVITIFRDNLIILSQSGLLTVTTLGCMFVLPFVPDRKPPEYYT
jgi:hypothetical protein